MRPPGTRTPRIDFNNIDVLRALFLNGTAAVVTLMLFRVATLLVENSDTGAIPGLVQTVTTPLVWPFQFIPPLAFEVVGSVTVIDLIIIPVIAVLGLLVAGIVTGWRDSSDRRRRHPAFEE
jgi:K+-sensing histidine kinase KdpD